MSLLNIHIKHLVFALLVALHLQVMATSKNRAEYLHDSVQIQSYLKSVEQLNKTTTLTKNSILQSQKLLNRAVALSQKWNDFHLSYLTNLSYGNLYAKSGNIYIAMTYYFKNQRLLDNAYRTNRDTLVEKRYIENNLLIANSYFYLKNYNKTLTYLKIAEQFLAHPTISVLHPYHAKTQIVIFNNLASFYIASHHDYKMARSYYQRALSLMNGDAASISSKASIYNNLGIISQREKDAAMAFRYYCQAQKLWSETNDTTGLIKVYNNFGSYYYDLANYKKSIEYLKMAFLYSDQQRLLDSKLIASQNLYECYRNQSDYKTALFYKEIASKTNDSIMSVDNIRNITQLELHYQYEKQIKEDEILKEIKKVQNQRLILLFIGVILVLILALIVFYLFNRNLQIKNREIILHEENLKLEKSNLELENKNLQSEIEFKNRELTTNVIYLLKKNELIASISEKLLAIQLHKQPKERSVIKSIVKELKLNIDNSSWNEFEVRFQHVHKDFLSQLNEKYPDLTPNEIKICSFLRLNMTTKDIAAITFQTTKSIDVARTRLRKKLDIDRDVNLVAFLQKL